MNTNSRLTPGAPTRHPEKRFVTIALPLLLLGAVMISLSAIFVRLSEVGPITTAFWRMSLAWPAFWLWLSRERWSVPPVKPAAAEYRRLIAVGLIFAGDLICWHLSIKFTTVANAVLLANFAPIFVTLGGWYFFRQRVSRIFIVGMVLAIGGAALLVGASLSLSWYYLLGDGLGLITAVFYGSYLLTVKQLRVSQSTATIMTWAAGVAALTLFPVALLIEGNFWPMTIWGLAVLLGLALFSHFGGQGLITFALAHLPASFSSVTLLLQPVLSAIFAWLLLGEILSPRQLSGGLVVLLGIMVARRGSRFG